MKEEQYLSLVKNVIKLIVQIKNANIHIISLNKCIIKKDLKPDIAHFTQII